MSNDVQTAMQAENGATSGAQTRDDGAISDDRDRLRRPVSSEIEWKSGS